MVCACRLPCNRGRHHIQVYLTGRIDHASSCSSALSAPLLINTTGASWFWIRLCVDLHAQRSVMYLEVHGRKAVPMLLQDGMPLLPAKLSQGILALQNQKGHIQHRNWNAFHRFAARPALMQPARPRLLLLFIQRPLPCVLTLARASVSRSCFLMLSRRAGGVVQLLMLLIGIRELLLVGKTQCC